jgi:YggT family protein
MTKVLLIRVISLFFNVMTWLIILRALLSWFSPNYRYRRAFWRAGRLLVALTDPVIEPIRRIGTVSAVGLDFTPLLAILLLGLVERVLIWIVVRIP